jgi:hypothetical protein
MKMNLTEKMFLFLCLLPTICFTCKCLGIKDNNGVGHECAYGLENYRWCYVYKKECRAKGIKVLDHWSTKPELMHPNIGYSTDFCFQKEHMTIDGHVNRLVNDTGKAFIGVGNDIENAAKETGKVFIGVGKDIENVAKETEKGFNEFINFFKKL